MLGFWKHWLLRDTRRRSARSNATGRVGQRRVRVRVEPLEDRTLLDAGALDPTFGGNAGTGRTLIDNGSNEGAAAVAFQGNKTIVVGSALIGPDYDIYVTRLNPDGSVDTTFGFGGHVSTNIQGDDYGAGVVVDSTGRIIVVGTADAKSTNTTTRSDMVVVRYTPDGSLDTTFNGTGIRRIDFGRYDYGSAVALYGDRIVVAGTGTNLASGHYDFSVARLLSDGELDTSFGGTGMVQTDLTGNPLNNDAATAVSTVGGYITVAGIANFGFGAVVDGSGFVPLGGSNADFGVVRYDYYGNLVSFFGNGTGKVTTDFGSNDVASSVAIRPDGRIVVAGATNFHATDNGNGTYTFSDAALAIAEYNYDGSPDTGFNGNGKFTLNLTSGADALSAVAIDSSGPVYKIVAAGARNLVYGGSSSDFLLLRLNPDGTLDPNFGSGGLETTGFANTVAADAAAGLGLAPDGRIVAVGSSQANGTPDLAVARFENDTVQLGAARFTAAENAGIANVTLTRTAGSTGSVTVQLATSDGTGRAGVNYQAVTQTVTFNNGETTKVVQIPVLDDQTVDGSFTVNLTLSNPAGGAELGSQYTAVLTITNSDQPPPPGPEGLVPQVVRQGKKSMVEVHSSAGVLMQTFGPFAGTVSAVLSDLNHDGIPDLVITVRSHGKKRVLGFDGRTLAPLPVPKKKKH
jgi:uncharacterized delta-60 repeat protein